ncbi:hypothetical protein BTO28_01850 [Domibacillus epiphyticus]|uniref:DUF2071 domain-containing protein n=1 Tax=Domibacillus epiphyticus TaxID=1714355 RepID=A0A1V2ABU4_9BACI|nr:hypothetical protein BTO28_01850 [Domibacillus epiphyticus]
MTVDFVEVEQRPFPLPSTPWVMTQTWDNMLFAHWPVPAHFLKAYIPGTLDIDTFDGTAWLGVIPFHAHHTKLRGMPPFPLYHSYLELNVRTYVTHKGIPGVYFFSMDANKWPVVLGAKMGTSLPYKHAHMGIRVKDPVVHYKSRRKHPDSPKESFHVSYKQSSSIYLPAEDSLEYWLLERYCLWTIKDSALFRGDIHHDRWRITKAEATFHDNTMASFLPRYYFKSKPILHFSGNKNVFIWPLKKTR